MIKLAVLLFCIFILPTSVRADLSPKDDASQEIRDLAKDGLRSMRGLTDEIDQILSQVESQLPNLRAQLTDEELLTGTGLTTQASIAMNFPKLGLIALNRRRWTQLTDHKLRVAIALHEVMSLIGIEKTGVYSLSASYIQSSGLSLNQLTHQFDASGFSAASDLDVGDCRWQGDRMLFAFEIWETSLRTCRPVASPVTGESRFKENWLRTTIDAVQKNCVGPHTTESAKFLENAQSLLKLVPQLKSIYPSDCAN